MLNLLSRGYRLDKSKSVFKLDCAYPRYFYEWDLYRDLDVFFTRTGKICGISQKNLEAFEKSGFGGQVKVTVYDTK